MEAIVTGWIQKFRGAISLFKKRGIYALLRRMYEYVKYYFCDQWRFVYLALPLDYPFPSLPPQKELVVYIATPKDQERVEAEIFPVIESKEENDKRFFRLLRENGVVCFLAEKSGRLVHYSWVFTNLRHAPIMHTPFNKKHLRASDVFLGPVFTNPSVRGLWIFPTVLGEIIKYLKNRGEVRRVLLFVDRKNQGAVPFFKRLGFEEIR